MAEKKVLKRLDEIKRRQAERGVIPSLRGRNWTKEDAQARQVHAEDLRHARAQLAPIGVPYGQTGNHYPRHKGFGRSTELLAPHINAAIRRAKKENRKVRWLDIGPGKPQNFMPFFERSDPENKKVELHTLSPEQILPKNHPRYDWWKGRLTHHVGSIETYDPRKLGKFHLVISEAGGTFYTKQPIEVLKKISGLLEHGGKAVLDCRIAKTLVLPALRRALGRRFRISTYRGRVVIIRSP